MRLVVTPRDEALFAYGQVAVEPVFVAGVDPRPHETTQFGPVQFVTLQPVAGQVTWQSPLLPHSTSHDAAVTHAT